MFRTHVLSAVCLLASLFGAGAPSRIHATPQPMSGQALSVTKFTDSADGLCDADCSLREAIDVANETLGADTITLGAGTYELTIPPEGSGENVTDDADNTISDLDLRDQLILIGAGSAKTVIMSKMHDRVLEVLEGAQVTLQAVAITGGNCDSNGGGIANAGKLTLRNVSVFANHSGSYEMGGNGGGIVNRTQGELFIDSSRITNNIASPGGSIPGSGGGIANWGASQILNSLIQGNNAGGGEDTGIGGGIANYGHLSMSRSAIISNTTLTVGGGVSNMDGGRLQIANTTVSGNAVQSQSAHPPEAAGGVANGRFTGTVGGEVALVHVTISGNTGAGLFNRSEMTLTNSIVAGNAKDRFSDATCSNIGTLTTLGANVFDDESACAVPPIGNVVIDNDAVFTNTLSPLGDYGGPTPTHLPLPVSVLVDTADDNFCSGDLDQRGVERPQGAHCDIGAVERQPSDNVTWIYVSSTSSVILNQAGIKANDEDILGYDMSTGKWAMVFDGSDVGITGDVDAFEFLDDGDILLSFDAPVKLPGIGKVDAADIVKFTPSQLGPTTRGLFTMWLDGATVGLKNGNDDIDVIAFTPDHRLLISTSNQFSLGTLKGCDEDIFVLNPTAAALGGTWAMYLDGSEVGLSTGRDVNGAWVDPVTGEIYLSTNGPYHVAGLAGDEDDIFICTPTTTSAHTQCAFRLFWDGDAVGFGGERLDGVALGHATHTLAINKLDELDSMDTPELLEPLGDDPWIEEAEDNRVFLPSLAF